MRLIFETKIKFIKTITTTGSENIVQLFRELRGNKIIRILIQNSHYHVRLK
jgi:hypothetical protein